MFGVEEENTSAQQARCLILAEAIPLSLHKLILLISLKHITGKSRNFTYKITSKIHSSKLQKLISWQAEVCDFCQRAVYCKDFLRGGIKIKLITALTCVSYDLIYILPN